jgi:hypothetical protein
MVAAVVAILALALALSGCGEAEQPRMPLACTDPAAVERALERAPAAVRLPDGTALSDCVDRARSGAELQELGTVLTRTAERLATKARDEADAAAATQLGYLGTAVARGAQRRQGAAAQLSRRLGQAWLKLEEAPAAVIRALQAGARAGGATG